LFKHDKNLFLDILFINGMSFQFEHLGKFQYVFETIGCELGDEGVILMKKPNVKISHASVPHNQLWTK
jgi:hypothetical protein